MSDLRRGLGCRSWSILTELFSFTLFGRFCAPAKLQLRFGLCWRLIAPFRFLYGGGCDLKFAIGLPSWLLVNTFVVCLLDVHWLLDESPLQANSQHPLVFGITRRPVFVFPPQLPSLVRFHGHRTFNAFECQTSGATFFTTFPAPWPNFVIYALCSIAISQLASSFIDVYPIKRWRVVRDERYKA